MLSIGLFLLNKKIVNNKYLKGAYYSALAVIPISIISIMYSHYFYIIWFMKTLSFSLLFLGICINRKLGKIKIVSIILIVLIIFQAMGAAIFASFPLLSPKITYKATWTFTLIGAINCVFGYFTLTSIKKTHIE
jgi:hypothetical protein